MVIGEDEKVQVPLLKDEFSGYRDKWGTSGGGERTKKRQDESLDELYADEFAPSIRLPQNPLITAAGISMALAIAAYSAAVR